MAAIGGYGFHYLQALLDETPRHAARLAGVVDPEARASAAWPRVAALGVPVVDAVGAFFDAGHRADLTVVVSPIHLHVPQSAEALERGSHVLCDKPLGASAAAADALAAARDRADRFVLVGYQWSYSAAVQALKRDLLAGRYGRPRRVTTLCAWPRDPAYYARNGWAGRLRDASTGALVLDSPANNAMAHFLHNAFFLVGPEIHRSAMPALVAAEMGRVFSIESADTTACRAETADGCEVLFLASHATERAIEPRFRVECERGSIVFGETRKRIVGTPEGEAPIDYGDPDATPQFQKLFTALGRAVSPGPVVCGIEAAAAQTVCVEAMHASVPEIAPFPAARRRTDPGGRPFVHRLADELERCYAARCLPSELGCAWARRGRPVVPAVPAGIAAGGSALTPIPGARWP